MPLTDPFEGVNVSMMSYNNESAWHQMSTPSPSFIPKMVECIYYNLVQRRSSEGWSRCMNAEKRYKAIDAQDDAEVVENDFNLARQRYTENSTLGDLIMSRINPLDFTKNHSANCFKQRIIRIMSF